MIPLGKKPAAVAPLQLLPAGFLRSATRMAERH
jgi:hypothetical protein